MILGLTWGAIALGLAATLVAGFVRGLAGFGLAILLVPVLALAISPPEAVVTGNWLGFMIRQVYCLNRFLETHLLYYKTNTIYEFALIRSVLQIIFH